MPEWLLNSAALIPLGIWALGTWAAHRMRVAEREGVWAAFAALRGGRLGVGDTEARGTLDLEARGVAVHVELERTRGRAEPLTRARAAYALGEGPAFRISPEYVLSSIDKRLGRQDHTLGHPDFDRLFVVEGGSALAVRAVLGVPLQELLATHLRHATLSSDGLFVTIEVPRVIGDALVLGALVDVVVGVASCGFAELEAMATLPGAHWQPPSGRWEARSPACLTLERDGVSIMLAMRVSERGLRAELSASSSRALPAIAVAIDPTGTPIGETPRGLLPAPRELALLAGARLTASGPAARLRFAPDRVPSPTSIEAGLALLSQLARGPASPFR